MDVSAEACDLFNFVMETDRKTVMVLSLCGFTLSAAALISLVSWRPRANTVDGAGRRVSPSLPCEDPSLDGLLGVFVNSKSSNNSVLL